MLNIDHKPELYGKLSATDFDKGSVWLIMEDGTTCDFKHAFWRYENNNWVVVYTEHNGYFIFLKDAISSMFGADFKATK